MNLSSYVPVVFLGLLWAAPATAQNLSALSREVRELVAIDAPTVALTNLGVIDGTGAPRRPEQTILIRDGLIAAVGPSESAVIPEGALVLELEGHTALPGIVGMHDHLGVGFDLRPQHDARLLLASGVTTIRTAGTHQPYSEINLKRDIEEGRRAGPRIHPTSSFVTGPDQPDVRMARVRNISDVRRFVDYWAGAGVSWIKAYTRIRRRELAAVIEEAHARGVKVTAHLCSVTAVEAAELGIDNIEHDIGDIDPGKPPDVCPQGVPPVRDPESEAFPTTIRTLVAHDVALTTTLTEAEAYEPHRPTVDTRVFEFMKPTALAEHRSLREWADSEAEPGYFAWVQTVIRTFVAAGGLLVAGTDPVFPGMLPGYSDQRNYELLVETGFAPEEAIRIMTANGARVLDVDRTLGTIEVGKAADLVVLQGDLVASPGAIRNVVHVFKDGVGYDPAKLVDSVRQELQRQE